MVNGDMYHKHHHFTASKMVRQVTQDFPHITIKNETNCKLKECQKTVLRW